MKILVAFMVVLSVFVTQSRGDEAFNIFSTNSNGGSVQETVSIDNQKNTATINIHAGSCSSTTIFDYKHGYIASRVFSRRACYILKMDHSAIPALDTLQRLLYEKQAMTAMDSSEYTWVRYNPLKSLIMRVDWFLFGSPIEQLCKHIPLYEGRWLKSQIMWPLESVPRLGFGGSWASLSVETLIFRMVG